MFSCFVFNYTGFAGGTSGKEPACQFRRCKRHDTGSILGSARSSGEGNSNPLQNFCLKNPMDRGAWLAIVYRVTKRQIWLKRLSMRLISYPKAPTKFWVALSPITFLWKSWSSQNSFCFVEFSFVPLWATEEKCFIAVVIICVFLVPDNNSNLHLLKENMKILSHARERIKNDPYLRTQPITTIILMFNFSPFSIKIIFTILHFSFDILHLIPHCGHVLALCMVFKTKIYKSA